MNFLKKMLRPSLKDELVAIPSGQLILSRSPASPKSESECLYNDCVATIRQSSIPFTYQLVIQRAYQEGEEELNETDDGDNSSYNNSILNNSGSSTTDEKIFIIEQSLKFHTFINHTDGNQIVSWFDLLGDDGDKFQFIIDISVNKNLINKFVKTIYKCEYEKKYLKSSVSCSDEDLEEFVVDVNELNNNINDNDVLYISSSSSSIISINDKNIDDEYAYADEEDNNNPLEDSSDGFDSDYQDAPPADHYKSRLRSSAKQPEAKPKSPSKSTAKSPTKSPTKSKSTSKPKSKSVSKDLNKELKQVIKPKPLPIESKIKSPSKSLSKSSSKFTTNSPILSPIKSPVKSTKSVKSPVKSKPASQIKSEIKDPIQSPPQSPIKPVESKKIDKNNKLFLDSNSDSDFDDDSDPDLFAPQLPKGDLISTDYAELHLYNPDSESFVLQKPVVKTSILSSGNWQYWLIIQDYTEEKKQADLLKSKINITKEKESTELSNDFILGPLIDQNMAPTFNFDHLSFIFNYFFQDRALSWLLKFNTFDELSNFQSSFMSALWESLNKIKWGKFKQKDESYIIDAFNDLNMDDNQSDVEEIEKYDKDDVEIDYYDNQSHTETETEPESDHETNNKNTKIRMSRKKQDDFSDDDDDFFNEDNERYNNQKFKNNKDKNTALTVSYKNDRSYVVRGDKIGVFKSDDSGLNFQNAIENIRDLKGKSFNPDKIMLHTEDRSLIMQSSNNKKELYKLDLEKGKVIEEYKIGEDIPVVEFNPTSKFSQMTNEQTFLGISSNGLFKVDPRISAKNKLVDSEYKQYKTKTNFSAMTTTSFGNIAVASKTGEIRLYDRLGINAKTQLPGLGEEIKGIETSSDGRWVLATCKTYLLLIDAKIKTGKNANLTGFMKSFSKDSKPIPRRLQISPQHIAYMQQQTGNNLDFTKAHFNTGIDAKETTIISSTGPYVVQWSLKKILRNDKDPYLIKKYDLNVMAENFKFGTDKNVILAMTDDVKMVSKKSFKKPTRATLAGSIDKDSIVKTY